MIRKHITIISMIILTLLALNNTLMSHKKIAKKSKTQMRNATAPAGNATGTDVFVGKTNASNALGVVGSSIYTIAAAPYVVKTCDQVLQIPGTTLDMDNYSEAGRKPAFMTLSIYFANFFPQKNSSMLVQSLETQLLTNELTEIAGAPGCTTFQTQKKQYNFCFASEEIRKQIQAAAQKFLNCKPANAKNEVSLEIALQGCDLSKADLTKKGPFGVAGPKIAAILLKMKNKKEKKIDWTGVNPYYVNKGIPGDHAPKTAKVAMN